MLELYVFTAILGLGYMLNNRRHNAQTQSVTNVGTRLGPNPKVGASTMPSVENAYHADNARKALMKERRIAARAHAASRDPRRTGVIPHVTSPEDLDVTNANAPNYRARTDAARRSPTYVTSPLTGMRMPVEHFTHNNMVPFFGSRVPRSMDHDAASHKLDALHGVANRYAAPKREIEPMFKPSRDVGNVNGMTGQVDLFRERIVPPKAQNNVFPIPREMVGPGINSYGAAPQPDVYYKQRQFTLPKTVDELRAGSNPKVSGLQGRVVAGQRGHERGVFSRFAKNRPERTAARKPGDNLVTTGAYRRETRRPDVVLAKPTNRPDTHVPYSGVAKLATGGAERAPERPSRAPHRQNLRGPHFQPGNIAYQGRGARDDYGRDSILVYANERDVTCTRTHVGNLTSVVKALVAPIQDVMRMSRKQYVAEAPAAPVGARPQIPNKPTVHDPDDVAKTTVKETTLHDASGAGALARTAQKGVVYDPDAVARTTLKETMLHDASGAGALGPTARKPIVYDPDAVARTTVRETTLHDASGSGALARTAQKGVAYDPDARARTTVRETTLHDASGAGQLAGGALARKGAVHDPDDVARTTLKETTLQEQPRVNVARVARKGTVKDPDDVARTTVKETLNVDGLAHPTITTGAKRPRAVAPGDRARHTVRQTLEESGAIEQQRPRNVRPARAAGAVQDPDDVARTTVKETTVQPTRPGQPDALERLRGGYESANYEAPPTQKEVLADTPYVGAATTGSVEAGGGGGGYQVAEPFVKDTQKQALADTPYHGPAGETSAKAPMSYEDVMTMMFNETREVVLAEREPTQTSTKVAAGPEAINLQPRRNPLPEDFEARALRNQVPDRRVAAHAAAGCAPSLATREPHTYDNWGEERLDDNVIRPQLRANPFALPPLSASASAGRADADADAAARGGAAEEDPEEEDGTALEEPPVAGDDDLEREMTANLESALAHA